MSNNHGPHQTQKRRRTTQTGATYEEFSHTGGMPFYAPAEQNLYNPEQSLVIPEEHNLQEEPEGYDHDDTAFYNQQVEALQMSQPRRAMSSPGPAPSTHPNDFSNIEDPAQLQQIAAYWRFMAQNQAGANAGANASANTGAWFNQDPYPPQRRGNVYNGKVTINGAPNIIKGNIYDAQHPDDNMASHIYNYNTFMGHNNKANIFEGNLPYQALGQINFLPNPGQWGFSNGVFTSQSQYQQPQPPPARGPYSQNMRQGR